MLILQIIFYTQWARLGHRVMGAGQTDKQSPDLGGFSPGVTS